MGTVKVDPRLRGDDEGWMAAMLRRERATILESFAEMAKVGRVSFPFPTFPRKRESMLDTVKVDPRLRGDDEGWMAASLFRHSRESGNPSWTR